jgi:molybdenum cofactor cytidylyltransferase
MSEGRHKLLLPLGDRPVIAHVLDTVLASQASPILLVLGHQAENMRAALAPYLTNPRVLFIENKQYREGMSTSLHAALRELPRSAPESTSALVILGDQPLLSSAILDTLITTRQTTGKPIIAPLYEGQRGNPVLFARDLYLELLEVRGDEGGRMVIARHREDVEAIEIGSKRASYDVDTWETYQAVVAEWQHLKP